MKKKFFNNTKWVACQKVCTAFINLLSISILARILDKEVFGLYALVQLLIGFSSIFSDLGISTSLYSQQNISKSQYSTLYYINLIFNVAVYVILLLCIPLIVSFFNEDELLKIIPLIGLVLVFNSFGKHFQVYAEKDLLFKSISIFSIVSSLISLVLTVGLALRGFGIYSFVYPLIAISLINSIFYILLMKGKYKLGLHFDFANTKKFIKIGLYQASSQIIDYFSIKIDILIISKLLGTEALGVYNLIKELTLRAYSLIYAVISKVSIPTLSKFNNNEKLLKEKYLLIVEYTTMFTALCYSFLALFAEETLGLVYGSGYVEYSAIFVIFCLVYMLISVSGLAGILVISKGKTQYSLVWTVFRLCVVAPMIYILGFKYGLLGVAIATLIFASQGLWSYWYIVLSRVQNNILFSDHFKSFFANLIMAFSAYLGSTFLIKHFNSENLVILIVVKCLIYFVIIVFYLYVFKRKTCKSILMFFKKSQRV